MSAPSPSASCDQRAWWQDALRHEGGPVDGWGAPAIIALAPAIAAEQPDAMHGMLSRWKGSRAFGHLDVVVACRQGRIPWEAPRHLLHAAIACGHSQAAASLGAVVASLHLLTDDPQYASGDPQAWLDLCATTLRPPVAHHASSAVSTSLSAWFATAGVVPDAERLRLLDRAMAVGATMPATMVQSVFLELRHVGSEIHSLLGDDAVRTRACLLYTSPSPRDH
jgi:hypothetical protein